MHASLVSLDRFSFAGVLKFKAIKKNQTYKRMLWDQGSILINHAQSEIHV